MADFLPPAPDCRIEILRVAHEGWAHGGPWTTIPGEILATLEDEEARDLLEVVAALPDGEQLACFVPTYGLRVWRGDAILGQVAICFRCHNAVTLVDGQKGWFRFDVASPEAQRLLAILRGHDPALAAPAQS